MKIGAKLPNSGTWPQRLGMAEMAARLEAAGFESLWVGDHVLTPQQPRTRDPYTASGRMITPTDEPWYDAVVAMTVAATATEHCEIGVGVLVLPLRQPVVMAKQLASVDAVAGGRLVAGVGAGWMQEEFDALGIHFASRGRALEEGVDLLRRTWSGVIGDMVCRPTPARATPILIGGMSRTACCRAGRLGDGWYAVQPADALDPSALAGCVALVRSAAADRPFGGRMVLRVTGSEGAAEKVGRSLPALAAAGVTEIVVDVPWVRPDGATEVFQLLSGHRPGRGP